MLNCHTNKETKLDPEDFILEGTPEGKEVFEKVVEIKELIKRVQELGYNVKLDFSEVSEDFKFTRFKGD